MSGHSKWNNIQKRKGVQDAKRSKEFTIAARMIIAAVKKNGITDPNENPFLRLALDKARSVNMPGENVKRAIEKGAGKSATGATLDEIVYEGYGPHGVGFIVQAHTDNKQRTGSEIRNIFARGGGSLAGPGAASFLFSQSEGEYTVNVPIPLSSADYERINALSEDLESHDDVDGVWHNGIMEE